MAKKPEKNLLDLFPRRCVEWEKVTDHCIDLILPKFRSRILKIWLVRVGKTPVFRIHLDKFGSYVWNYCDGSHSIFEMGQMLEKKYGKDIEPIYERLSLFIQTLHRHHYIILDSKKTNSAAL